MYAPLYYPKFDDEYMNSTFGDNFKIMKKRDGDMEESMFRQSFISFGDMMTKIHPDKINDKYEKLKLPEIQAKRKNLS